MRRILFENAWVSLMIFWRYVWRLWFFMALTGTGLSFSFYAATHGRGLSHAGDLHMLYWEALMLMLAISVYSILIWHSQSLYKPLHAKRATITMWLERKGQVVPSRWRRMWICWWAFNWRYAVISLPLFWIVAAFSKGQSLGLPMDAAISLWSGWLAMWWWLFHPLGKSHFMLQRSDEAHS